MNNGFFNLIHSALQSLITNSKSYTMEKIKTKTGPKCPQCEIVGIEYITYEDSTEESGGGDAWFNVAHCNQCGHIHGIFNKVSNPPSINIQ